MSNILKNINIPIIVGPTAIGKTSISLILAEKFNSEIISADSRQIVREMTIGTAKPTPEELSKAKHHFINIIEPTDDIYNSYIYGNEVRDKLTELYSTGKKAILCGGSGLYIQSAVHGFFDDLGINDVEKLEYRKELEALPIEECYAMLQKADPEYAEKTPPGQRQRIHRALEVFHFTGKKLSELHKEHQDKRFFEPIYIGLNLDREKLYERINSRVLTMIDEGLIEEVESLANKYGSDLKRLRKTIGYKEVVEFLNGTISKDTMIDEIQKNTRHFSKRQVTWFKRIPGMNWFEPGQVDEIFKYVNNQLI
ncbi:MAG: tRNA (adenosine(37)-N6)-dimethylallyltransferase MiaA [Candidatus Delongbacteria bacterium]|jgi:tRNA dimethylallyltransferase|nr:tRNA (adenosine(37)-N6)-dimethylallyltransferase MiaA [Candidatus Delongbacteria bacterium]